jgi:hypothetical protein
MNENVGKSVGRKIILEEVRAALDAQVICGEDKLQAEIRTACGCDLMSDVLAFTEPGSVLLTGLTNQQVIRTAEMLDLTAIIFVRDKQPDEATLQLAISKGMLVLTTPLPLYESCGRLYKLGLVGCDNSAPKKRAKVRRKDLERASNTVLSGEV